jgi:Sec-independent protein translocase protein TatA
MMRDIATYETNAWGPEGAMRLPESGRKMLQTIREAQQKLQNVMIDGEFELQLLERFKNGISLVQDVGANMRYSSDLVETKKSIKRIRLYIEEK